MITEEDRDRAARAVAAALRVRLVELGRLDLHAGSPDRARVVAYQHRDLAKLTADEVREVNALCWKHRRVLPTYLAPKLPPLDPIVRAMELQYA